MSPHPVEKLIAQADAAINREDFDSLMEFYAEDAVLVVQPGRNAVGKERIRQAFEAIAQYFGHGLEVRQAGLEVLATGDTALALAKTLVRAPGHPPPSAKPPMSLKRTRRATGAASSTTPTATTCWASPHQPSATRALNRHSQGGSGQASQGLGCQSVSTGATTFGGGSSLPDPLCHRRHAGRAQTAGVLPIRRGLSDAVGAAWRFLAKPQARGWARGQRRW